MARRIPRPEVEFLRAVFGRKLPERTLEVPFTPEGEMALRELRHEIDAALDLLSYRDRGILEMRFGLGDGYAYSLAETGFVFSLTRERIRQLQVRGLASLREGAEPLREFLDSLG